MSALGFQFDELLGHLIVRSLRQDAQDGPARFVEVHASAERTPAGTAALLDDVAQLHDGHADEAILAREAVVLHTDVQLKGVRLVLVPQNTEKTANRSYGNVS